MTESEETTGPGKAPPLSRTGMLIRRPISEVWQALVDPEITAKFWFSDGEGRLDRVGAAARWNWRWYGFHVMATAVEIEPERRLVYDWGTPDEAPTRVAYRLAQHTDGTFVEIDSWGFSGDDTEKAAAAADSAGGFSFVLAGLKAWLEHGIRLNLVEDRMPKGVPDR